MNKSSEVLVQQTKDFLAYCDNDTYTYSRIYSAKKLMRALEQPYYRDIVGQFHALFEKIMENDILYGGSRELDWHNIEEVGQMIKSELTDQVLSFSGARSEKAIATLDMKKIRKEYVVFLREHKREEGEVKGENFKKDQLELNPYEYLHNTH